MQQKLKDNPWPVYKIKMGFPNDVETLRSLRNVTDSPFRVDVNEGWTATEAIDKLTMIANMQVELVEQPTEKYNTEQARHIYELSPLPVFADESCVSEKDILGCTGLYHGVNIKLTKCSGITPARRMIQEAKKNGLKVMLGCMNETSLGTAAMLHLAPMVDYLDADGPLLLKESAVQSLSIQNGKYDMPTGNGLGVVVDFDQI
jgi:L-alanine-DL-glutamate epimerase-like enolase superfamily enzyme